MRAVPMPSRHLELKMPPFADDERRPDRPSASDALGALADLDEVRAARTLPGILVGLVLAFPIFIVAAVAMGVAIYGFYALVQPTGLLASALGIVWLGGSLAITALAIRPLLRRINNFLSRRSWPTLY